MQKERRFSIPLFPKFLFSTHTKRSVRSQTTEFSKPDCKPAKYLDGHVSYLRCSRCGVDLCLTSQIVSKGFTGRHGRAYLVSPKPSASAMSMSTSTSASHTGSLSNTIIQKPVPRWLVTGAHTVCDINCAFCGTVLGWKYVAAEEEGQRYKVGKSILEMKRVTRFSCWEGLSPNTDFFTTSSLGQQLPSTQEERGENAPALMTSGCIEFDSQDEDECEDLFAGIWSPELAVRRRRHLRKL